LNPILAGLHIPYLLGMKLSHKESKGMLGALRDVVVSRYGSIEGYAQSRGVSPENLKRLRITEKAAKV
jgi:hypothetical protein